MAFGIGDTLSVRLTAQTKDFTRSLEESQEHLSDLGATSAGVTSPALQALGGRADEAGDEFGRLGRKVRGAGTSLTAFSASAIGATTATRTLSTATTASLVPAIGAASTAVVPLTAALGGLATASAGVASGFAAVIGTGAFAYSERLSESNQKRLEQIKTKIRRLETLRQETGSLTDAQQRQLRSLKSTRDEVKETTSNMGALSQALEPVKEQLRDSAMNLGTQFIPLIKDTISALPAFIRRIEESIGSLQPFADALRDAGDVAFDLFPRMTEVLMNMARDALPAVRDLGRFLANNAIPAMRAMGDTLGRVADLVPQLGSTMASVLPKINQFGLTLLETVVPALQSAGGKVVDLIEAFNQLDKRTQQISLGAALSAPAVLGIITRLSMISPILGALAGAVAALGAAWVTNFGGIQEKTTDAIDTLQPYFEDFMGVLEQVGTVVMDVFRGFARTAQRVFRDVGRFVQNNERAFRSFFSGVRNAITGVVSFFQTVLLPAAQFAFQTLMKSLNPIINVLKKNLGPTLDEIGQSMNAVVGYAETAGNVMLKVWNSIDGVVVPIIEGVASVIGDTLGYVIEQVLTGFRAIMNLVQGDFDGAMKNLETMLNNTISAAFDIVGILEDALAATVTWLQKDGLDTMIGVMMGLFETGLALNDIFIETLKNAPSWLVENVTKPLFNTIKDVIQRAVIAGITGGLSETEFTEDEGIDTTKFTGPNVPTIPSAHTGGFIARGGLARLHQGERVVPAAQVEDRGPVQQSGEVTVNLDVETRVTDDGKLVTEADVRRAQRTSGRGANP